MAAAYAAGDDTVVGVIVGRFDENYDDEYAPAGYPRPQAWIFDIVVDEAVRRSGIGSALIKQFVADAADAGRTYVALEVNLQHQAGLDARLAFFKRKGFQTLKPLAGLPHIMGSPIEVVRQHVTPTQG